MNVPCNGCTACCHRDTIPLLPEDPRGVYKTRTVAGRLVLEQKPNGDCIYLVPGGCSIHESKPSICKAMDCRELYRMTSPIDRYRKSMGDWKYIAVYKAGAERMGK